MVKKMNNFLGEETSKTVPKSSRKKLRRSRKPKFEVLKLKQRIDGKKKDKKRKRKLTAVNTWIAQRREELGLISDDIWEFNRRLDGFPSIFAEIRENNLQQQVLNCEINAFILELLKALGGDED